MAKIRIVGPRALMDGCIKTLHELSILHMEKRAASPERAKGLLIDNRPEKTNDAERLTNAASSVRETIKLLPLKADIIPANVEREDIYELAPRLDKVRGDVKTIVAGINRLKETLSMTVKYERMLATFVPIASRLGGFKNLDVIGLTVEKRRAGAVRLLEDEVRRLTKGGFRFISANVDDDNIGIVIAFQKRFGPGIKSLLTGKGVSEVRLPSEYEDMTLVKAIMEMKRRSAEIPTAVAEAELRLNEIAKEWHPVLSGLLRAIEDALDELDALAGVEETRFTFVVRGYVPIDELKPLEQRLCDEFGEKVVVRALEIREDEYRAVPVKIENPPFLRPFEVFLSAVSRPMYGSVDPTPYIAVFFPAFFGLIVGDAGYGVVLLGLGMYLKARFKDKGAPSDIARVLVVSACSAVVFGVLFGEFFGDLGPSLFPATRRWLPVLFDRGEALKTFLALSLGVGALHVMLGLGIGALNRLLRGRGTEAVAKAAHLGVMLSTFTVMAALSGYIPRPYLTPAGATLGLSVLALVLTEGATGPLESIKALGAIVSYVRLMAVGASSVVMAGVANRLGREFTPLALGAVVAGVLHVVNITLSLLSPSIQSMRLHYVEFFGRFYEGNGLAYKPLKKGGARLTRA